MLGLKNFDACNIIITRETEDILHSYRELRGLLHDEGKIDYFGMF